MTTRRERIKAYGDFQTPLTLANEVTKLVHRKGFAPLSILEPTCGKGNFLVASLETFSDAQAFRGIDVDRDYALQAREATLGYVDSIPGEILCANVFDTDLHNTMSNLPDPLLILGNPPWITISEMASLNIGNVPTKSNFKGDKGINAMTGKSNFDISEWIILTLLETFRTRDAMLAMLCKTSVARKVLKMAWKLGYPIAETSLYRIDAKRFFNVDVDACLFIARSGVAPQNPSCPVFEDINSSDPDQEIGFDNGVVIADLDLHRGTKHLMGKDAKYVWRSGIKHDCAKIMELTREGKAYRNGLGDVVTIEDALVHRLYKSSDIANPNRTRTAKYVIVPQRNIGDGTSYISEVAPLTWEYLNLHLSHFQKRRSRIYTDRPDFSIFGVGDYTFTPWKVAVSGFYKKLKFVVVPPENGKPAMVDDTVYYLPCMNEEKAFMLADVLNSVTAKAFFSSMIFWSDKRPITAELLKRLHLSRLLSDPEMPAQLQLIAA